MRTQCIFDATTEKCTVIWQHLLNPNLTLEEYFQTHTLSTGLTYNRVWYFHQSRDTTADKNKRHLWKDMEGFLFPDVSSICIISKVSPSAGKKLGRFSPDFPHLLLGKFYMWQWFESYVENPLPKLPSSSQSQSYSTLLRSLPQFV